MIDKTDNPILNLLFADHQVRLIPRLPEPWLILGDVCDALALSNPSKAAQSIPAKWRSNLTIGEVRTINGEGCKRGENISRSPIIVSPAGAMFLAFRSKKPEARAFVDWLLDDVLPQIAKYGVYVAGSDPEEKCKLLWHRWRVEREREIGRGSELLTRQGLQTISSFRESHDVHDRDLLSLARIAAHCAIKAGEDRIRVFTRRGMRRAYSDAVLRSALERLQPQLPLVELIS